MKAGFVAAIAAVALSGCNSRVETGRCVDAQGRVLPDSACNGGAGGIYHYPHWVYGGSVRNGVATGYSTRPSYSGSRITTPSGRVIRGGFGGGFHGFGGG